MRVQPLPPHGLVGSQHVGNQGRLSTGLGAAGATKNQRTGCPNLFANISFWNAASSAELREHEFDYVGLSETHVSHTGASSMEGDLRRVGYGLSNLVHAECTSEKGTSGGLVIASHNPLHLGLPQDAPRAVRWQCGVIRLGKVTVLLINVYLYVEYGLSLNISPFCVKSNNTGWSLPCRTSLVETLIWTKMKFKGLVLFKIS